MGKLNDFILKLKEKSFIKSLINDLNSDIYAVGGVVRDLILNKPNKDIDLVVRRVPIDTLVKHLQKFGKVDVVGKSFGVIKFIDSDGTDYDIALPRRDMKNSEGGYRGFDVQSDPDLSIEDELIRRDAKFNAMAININTGKFIDPLGGLEDIEKKQISAANPDAFSDDPLRMLRIVQFASRFGFTIEPETMKMIQNNAGRIKEIPAERILIELDKIVKKGDKLVGVDLLRKSGLFKQIFGHDIGINRVEPWNQVRTMGEYVYLMTKDIFDNPQEFYLKNLKGDIDTYKEIRALDVAFKNDNSNPIAARSIAHNMYSISPISLQSQILPKNIKIAAQELLSGKYPKTIGELAVNGNDLITLGLKGKEIGDALKNMLLKVYSDKIQNNKEELLNLVSNFNDSNMIKENIKKEKVKNVLYSAVVLDEKSRSKLIEKFKSLIPDNYQIIAHHMTINMGEIDPELAKYLELPVRLWVNDIAADDKVIAVGVSGFESHNTKPHITIAVNRQNGGKPMMSNNLVDWKKLDKPFPVTGKVMEVKFK